MAIASTTSAHAFGIALKRARRSARLTQAELAERAGFSVVYVSMLERGARQPQPSTVALFADALDISEAERAVLESTTQVPNVARRRRGGEQATHLTVGGYLGALPASSLVGRERELAVVEDALGTAASGQGQLLLLIGEPGIGKTRLAQEITIRARARGFRVLTGRCYEPQQTIAYSPFLEALTQAVALTTGAIERWPEVARLLPDQLADVSVPAQLEDGNAQQRLFWQVAGFLGALSDQTPLVLLLDDLHWADSASLDLLQHLTRHVHDQPVLLVGTAREVEAQRQHPLTDALSDLRREDLLERLAVGPLGSEETSELIRATLGAGEGAEGGMTTVSSELALRIYARSEGNAFFTRQLTRALQEQGGLALAEREWRVNASSVSALEVPESIRAVIGLRLGHLTAHTQDVLREASVLGQVFVFGDLQRMSHRGEQEVEEALEEAAGAGIVREGAHDQYHLNHALTHDTLYAELSARKKRRLHRAAADSIERLPDHERRAADLAYHLLAADEGERALPYALLAGDQAESVYAHTDAEGHYRAALVVAQELGDQAREAEALEKLGKSIQQLGRHHESAEICQRALRAYQELHDPLGELHAVAGLLLAQAEVGRVHLEEAVAQARAVLARIEPSDSSTLTPALGSALAAAHSNLGWILWTSGLFTDAQVEIRQAIDLARAANDEAQLTWAQFRLLIAGGLKQTAAAFEETLALAERSGQTAIVVTSHNMAAFKYEEDGDFARALAHMEQSVAMAEQRQDLRHLAHQLKNFALFLFDYGDWQRMRDVFTHAESVMQEADHYYGETWQSAGITATRGMLTLAEGGEEDGRRLLEAAMEGFTRAGFGLGLVSPTCALAEADLLAGYAEQARRRLTTLLSDPNTTPAEGNDRGPLLFLAWAEMALGHLEDAEARLNALLTGATPLCRADALWVQGLLATLQKRWDKGVAALDEALALTRAMPFPYAELKALWVYGQLEAARQNPAAVRKHFKQALAICDRLGENLYRKRIERDLRRLAQKA